jgi:hypothetical protein
MAALHRLRRPAWAIAPVVSIAGVVFAVRAAPNSARALTYLALVAVPVLAAGALAVLARGARPGRAALVLPLFALAWIDRGGLVGEASGLALEALSCVTLGCLLVAVAPRRWLRIGVVLMAAADTWLVVADLLQAPNAVLIAAHPAGGLPQLQRVLFGSATLGYGDLFVAGVVGALFAADAKLQRRAVLLAAALALASDLLFFVVRELPATVPIAIAMLAVDCSRRRRGAQAPVGTRADSRETTSSTVHSRTPIRSSSLSPRSYSPELASRTSAMRKSRSLAS